MHNFGHPRFSGRVTGHRLCAYAALEWEWSCLPSPGQTAHGIGRQAGVTALAAKMPLEFSVLRMSSGVFSFVHIRPEQQQQVMGRLKQFSVTNPKFSVEFLVVHRELSAPNCAIWCDWDLRFESSNRVTSDLKAAGKDQRHLKNRA